MVLAPTDFCLHPSLRKTVKKFMRAEYGEIRIDTAFESVIQGCATSQRDGQHGTWIVPDMVDAYIELHRAGFAHSIETWIHNELVGGLYFVAIGRAVFGESMFHRVTDSSKIALVALVCLCKKLQISQIDCQQNTRHLASLGAKEIHRHVFNLAVDSLSKHRTPEWQFSAADWHQITALTPDRT
jgi:leucyl/phenylalanyl-tRNA--protein transferase